MARAGRTMLVASFVLCWGCSSSTFQDPVSADAGGDDALDGSDGGDANTDFEPVGLIINEVSAGAVPDWVELYNGTAQPIDLVFYTFTDDLLTPTKGRFRDGTTINSGAYLTVTLDGTWPGFGLGGDEEFGIFDASGVVADSVDWMEGDCAPGGSYGRIPDLTGPFKALSRQTAGLPNVDNPDGAVCGDGVQEGDEECDDGNRIADDACSLWCTELLVPECGDGVREGAEECDGADVTDPYTCEACRLVPLASDVVLNEVVATPGVGASDWVELVNRSATNRDLSGWYLTDSDPAHVFVFLPGTTLVAGGYALIERGGDGFEFGLGTADELLLYNSTGDLVDRALWTDGDAPEGSSWGRSPDSTGDFVTLSAPTPGTANSGT